MNATRDAVAVAEGHRDSRPNGSTSHWMDTLAEGDAQLSGLVREHPVACVLGAAALGFLIARLVRES